MLETLNEIGRLRDVRFGRPWPRHGLKLLHWFANECLSFDTQNNMLCECEPEDGEYGFHPYENRDDLLPEFSDVSYYVVGNLNSQGAEDLPKFVLEDKFTFQYDSNTDRIIVGLRDDGFHSVYVTQHIDKSNYDPNATYKISRGLLMIIRRMTLEPFLETTGYTVSPRTTDPRSHVIEISDSESTDSKTNGPDFSVSGISDSEHHEPPAAQKDIKIKMPETDKPTERGFWESYCTIL